MDLKIGVPNKVYVVEQFEFWPVRAPDFHKIAGNFVETLALFSMVSKVNM